MRAAYGGLRTYQGNVSLTASEILGRAPTRASIALRKPSQIAITTTTPDGAARTVLDNKTVRATRPGEPGKYLSRPAPSAPGRALADALVEADVAGPGLIPLLAGDDPLAIFGPALKRARLDDGAAAATGDKTLDGVPVQTILAEMQINDRPASLALAVGANDHLLRRAVFTQQIGGNQTITITETHTNVRANGTLAPGAFAFTPPKGARAVVSFDPLPYDERLVAGARPFPIQARDTSGKPVSLDQYRNKVVLVDFWATWCGPCVAELPNVVAAYNKFHAQGFDVLGVSLDRPGDEAKLRQFVRDKKMPWRQIYAGGETIARTYGVQAIPFTLLIGRDGRIAGVNLRGDDLEPAVKAALAAKK
jgi:peroxiredoxin/outer membrane lipoprotein-sorting protein